MLSPEENERVTRVGRGTPMGETFRRYWIPVALSSELTEADGDPVRVRVLGEDLVAFRATDGAIGLVDASCPHRLAPMFFGRNEECGLRCVYHGWKFDVHGTCVDMPSEPPDSLFKTKVTIAAYPTWEGGGIVWAYLGPKETMPPPPDYELTRAPATHRHTSKTFEACNWMQALEGGIDTAHSTHLHNMAIHDKTRLRNRDGAPRIEVERTDYGYRYAGVRRAGDDDYVRVYHYVMPAQQIRGGVTDRHGKGLNEVPAIHGHIWVPIDDESCFAYNWMYSYDPQIPITPEWAESWESYTGRGKEHLLPGFRLKQNKDNDYLIDRDVQRTQTATGIAGVNTQDFAMQEGMGTVVDRSREHLGTSDRAIIAMRQLLVEAIDAVARGERPRAAAPDAYAKVRATDRLIPHGEPWRERLESELVARF
jgi:phenylpropionate dioxygenase-like ring-hydroxylating dioxygenase large terminal subunit